MTQPVVIRDVEHPDFPHGHVKGYRRGCVCERCRSAYNRYRKRTKAARAGILPASSTSLIDSTQMLRHVDSLIRRGMRPSDIAAVANMRRSTLNRLLQLRRRTVTRRVASKLLSVTPEQVLAADGARVDNKMTVVRTRSLQALGWPLTWQAKQIGIPRLTRHHYDLGHLCSVADALAIKHLAERIGDQAADPSTSGLSRNAIGCARAIARSGGWYPPVCYDEYGDLIQEALVGQPAVSVTYRERCRRYVAMVALTLQGMSAERIGRQIGVEARSVQRVRAMVALDRDYSGRPLDPAHFECVRQVVADADLPAAGIFGSEAPEVIWARLEQLTAAAVASAA